MNDFVTCTVEGINYVATSKDITIMQDMYVSRVNYSATGIKMFHDLAKKYFNVDERAGYFFDLGANIGTTGIYFCKKLAPNLKCLAFEPDAENFKLLRINAILNDMEDKVTLVNFGLGDKFDEMTMYKDLFNPGHNNVTEPKDNVPTETIKIIPLDSYLDENKIAAEEVKYIWIDTEGFEPQVLLGAKNLLVKNPAPVHMEFNPKEWNKSGFFDRFVELLKAVGYSHFIWVQEIIRLGEEKIYPIDKLWDWKNTNAGFGELGDIFLIKAGAVN